MDYHFKKLAHVFKQKINRTLFLVCQYPVFLIQPSVKNLYLFPNIFRHVKKKVSADLGIYSSSLWVNTLLLRRLWSKHSLPQGPVIGHSDRVLIVAPHPDDETIDNTGIIRYCIEKNIPVHVVIVTNGGDSVSTGEKKAQ